MGLDSLVSKMSLFPYISTILAFIIISASAGPKFKVPNLCDLSPQVILVKGKLDDRNFMKKQIKCMLSNDINDCDETGRKAKILGPQILSKRCPARVCDKCTKHAVNMVVQRMQSQYPKDWYQIVGHMGPPRG